MYPTPRLLSCRIATSGGVLVSRVLPLPCGGDSRIHQMPAPKSATRTTTAMTKLERCMARPLDEWTDEKIKGRVTIADAGKGRKPARSGGDDANAPWRWGRFTLARRESGHAAENKPRRERRPSSGPLF